MPEIDINERAAGVFAPDTLLATQYFDRVRQRKDMTGEQRLMIAVLEAAVEDFMKHATATDRLRQGLFAEAEAWIESADRARLYAFATVCDHLGLDVDYMRRGLRAWRARASERAGSAPAGVPPVMGPVEAEAPPERRRAGNE